jgi:hypothetical protein
MLKVRFGLLYYASQGGMLLTKPLHRSQILLAEEMQGVWGSSKASKQHEVQVVKAVSGFVGDKASKSARSLRQEDCYG